MATGTILSIKASGTSAPPTKGTVQQDVTLVVFTFVDPNFPSTVLNVGDKCTFDVDPVSNVASNLQPIPQGVNTIIDKPSGDFTANPGDTVTVTGNGSVQNLTINGGTAIIEKTGVVHGTATVTNNGNLEARTGGKVKGTITLNQGGNLRIINKGKAVGGINVMQGGRMTIGNADGPGLIKGPIDIVNIQALDITPESRIGGPDAAFD